MKPFEKHNTSIKTIKDLKDFLNNYEETTPVFLTNGDRVYNIEVFFGKITGQEHPRKKWDYTGIFIEID